MTVYYDRQSILVTEQMMRVGDKIYVVAAIEDVRLGSRRSRRMSLLASVALIPVALTAVSLAARGAMIGVLLVAIVGLTVTIGAAVMMTQLRPYVHELWIQYDGALLKVVETDEAWRAQQLARSLRKAVDASRRLSI